MRTGFPETQPTLVSGNVALELSANIGNAEIFWISVLARGRSFRLPSVTLLPSSGQKFRRAAQKLRSRKHGLTLTVGDIHSLALPPNAFDNVTLFHVLEHVHDPHAMLIRSWELLTENGMLFICVPNDVLAWSSRIKALGKRMGIPQFQKFSPRFGLALVGESSEIHLSHFTSNSLSRVVEKAGYNICVIGLDPYFAASWTWTLPHFLYLGLHTALYRANGTSHYKTIMLVAQRRKR